MQIEMIVDGQYKLKLDVPASNVAELREKLSAFKMLCNKLKHEDLVITSEMIKERPLLIPAIKEILEDSKDKNQLQIAANSFGYISKIMKVIKGE